jgi:hypothetical protein
MPGHDVESTAEIVTTNKQNDMTMEKEYIQKLLDRYMSAETTKEEEQLLSDYFSSHREIPAEWRGYSILFRGIKQYKPMKIASHRSVVLKWSAVAAIITVIFGTGLLLMRQDKTSIKPSDSVSYVNEPYKQNVIEPKHETGMTESVQAELPVERSAQKHRVRKSKKEVIPSTPAEPLPDISQPVRSLIPADASTRSLSSHREQMRNNIEAIFEQNTIFIAQNTVEL